MSVLWQERGRHPRVSDRVFKRFLRFPPARTFAPPLEENARWAREWYAAHGRPWSCAWRADGAAASALGPPGCRDEALAVVAVSAGAEAETEAAARWQAGEPDRYFFLESLASAVVEALLAEARARLGAARHDCPGYPGWPVEHNARLLAALHAAGALAGPLDVLPSGMLVPKKSQLAVCAVALSASA